MAMNAYEMLEETRIAIEEALAKMLFIKREGKKDPKSRAELRELVTQISVLFISLRQANRAILQEEDRVKAETEQAKVPVDHTMLQLHNLIYEKNHYLKAIKACKDFKSKYPDIDLVPEEEFFKNAPEELKSDPSLKEDPHKLMLHRLNYELYQRKELCKQQEELEKRKKILLETIASRKKFISSLPSHLKALKKASLPVQQQLGIPHSKRMKQHQLAELLPAPLYIVYSQLLAQKEAFEEAIDLEIVGSIKDAQSFARQQANRDAGVSVSLDEGKIDEDMPDEEEDFQRRRKRSKRIQSKDNADMTGTYQGHPLSLVLHILDNEATPTTKPSKLVTLRFEYLLKMHVVTVGIDGFQSSNEDNFLINLFPDDTGLELPHEIAKLSTNLKISYDEKRAQRPFKWAQHLAGIDFLPETPLLFSDATGNNDGGKNGSVIAGLALYRQQHRVSTILERIRDRKKSQMALKEQLDLLAKLKLPQITYKNVPWATHTPKCSLHDWFSLELKHKQTSASSVGVEEAETSMVLDGASSFLKAELESATEDGELPSVIHPTAVNIMGIRIDPPQKEYSLENSSRLALLSKSPASSKRKSEKYPNIGDSLTEDLEEDLALALQDELDGPELALIEVENDDSENLQKGSKPVKAWEEYAVKEYCAIYRRDLGSNHTPLDLEAKVKISPEYPLRPPMFSLRLLSGKSKHSSPIIKAGTVHVTHEATTRVPGLEWYNELRAMEAELNVHILKALPEEEENKLLSHQLSFFAMLFDLYTEQDILHTEHQKGVAVIDVGLSEPISGRLLSRLIRGRDRRRMISWNNK